MAVLDRTSTLEPIREKVEAGERFGIIRFGSRTDCFMPRGTQALVQPGDRVVGGETVIGMLG